MIKLINLLKEVTKTIDLKSLEQEASSIQGERIIATIDDFGDYMAFPSDDILEKIATKYNVGYSVKVYPKDKAIIFYNKSNPNTKKALNLYNKYMTDYSLSNDEHISLGSFFGYSDEAITDFIQGINSDITFNKDILKQQTLFKKDEVYTLINDIPSDIKFSTTFAPVIKKGDKFKVTSIEPNPTNQWWVVSVNALNYPEKKYLDFRIEPPNKPNDKYDKFVFQNIKVN